MVSKCEWAEYINKEDPSVRPRPSSVVSIFRVPYFLKSIKEEAYVPQRVSLGPYHHGCAELPPMGHHKGRALRGMMKKCKVNIRNNMDFANRAVDEILKLEDEIRNSYEENIDCSGEDLARMLCLDGCFILQVFRTLTGNELSIEKAENSYHPIFGKNKLGYAASDILSDILMLENQIPFFVLRKLLQVELNPAVDVDKMLFDVLRNVALSWFNPFYDEKEDTKQWSGQKPDGQEVHHLLGLLHTLIASPTTSSEASEGKPDISIGCCSRLQDKNIENIEVIPHATELRNAGIKFKKCEGGIKGIRFEHKSATIFLPPLCIKDRTEIIFRNLIAYEMCKPFEVNYVTGYVSLMDDLIDSEQDVALLRRMGILKNYLGSDKEVANLFNALRKGVTVSMEDVFDKLTDKVNKHYESKSKVICAEFVKNYFSSPWKALAWAAAIVGLLLTVVQTICAIILLYK